MSRRLAQVLILFALACAGFGEELKPLAPSLPWEKKFVEKLQTKVTVDFADASLNKVFVYFNAQCKAVFVVDAPLLSSPVTLSIKNETVENAVVKVLRLSNAAWELRDGAMYVRKIGSPTHPDPKPLTPSSDWEKEFRKKLQKRIEFEFDETPFSEAIGKLYELAKVNMVVDPALLKNERPITLWVTGLSAENSLRAILRLHDADWEMLDGALFLYKAGSYARHAPLTPTAEQAEQFKKAVSDLGSEDFNTRDAATRKIRDIGPAARTLMEAASRNSSDIETVARIKSLLHALPGPGIFEESPEVTKFLADLEFRRKVKSLEYDETPFEECVEDLRKYTKTTIALEKEGEDAYPDINMNVAGMELASALRWVVRLGGAKLIIANGALKIVKDEAPATDIKK